MKGKKKKVLVLGASITGIPVVEKLYQMGNDIILNDIRKIEDLKENIEPIKDLNINIVAGEHPVSLAKECDYVVMSPGIPLDIPLVREAKLLGKEVISEIELAYRLTNANIAAITGTNGKTTTTTLLGEMLNNGNIKTFVAGNIGSPMISKIDEAKPGDIFVLEVSSFQLQSTVCFKPKISAILNITPDHLNWHKTMENYVNAKCKIFINQTEGDFTILNKDNPVTKELKNMPKSKVLFFSRKEPLEQGAFIEDGYLKVKLDGEPVNIIHKDDIFIPGNHNIENSLAASLMAYCLRVEPSIIRETLTKFKGVEHRTEYVCTIDGVSYYNDSKGTNPESSIKALEAMKKPIILIAGGYDKGSEFDEFVKAFNGKVKALILIGETSEKIKYEAKKHGFVNIKKAKDLEEAVFLAKEISKAGDTVLLSPACASWDMFKNFEERGTAYKSIVLRIGRSTNACKEKY